MSSFTVEPANSLGLDSLAQLLNRIFCDYAVPLQIAPSFLASMVERDDILLDASYIASHRGEPLGVALIAVRPWHRATRSRVATMGVVPEARRRGIGQMLLRRAIADARSRGSRSLILEAFASNVAALRLYEAHAFVARRRLLGFSLDAARLRAPDGISASLRPIDSKAALTLLAACTVGEPAEAAPPWQLDAPSLARFGPPTNLYAVETPGAIGPVGYLVLGSTRPPAHLVHLGILPRWRRQGVATAALAAALRLHPDITSLFVPPILPEASSLIPFLQALGSRLDDTEQFEMELDLAAR
jgi:ribosomal protein S18 acetylase RimI-like enzyme